MVDAGVTQGWKCHTQMTMNIIVPVGQVRFVFYSKDANEFRVEDIGVERYVRITVPPGIWFAFRGLISSQSLVLNIASIEYSSEEVDRKTLGEINYDWGMNQ